MRPLSDARHLYIAQPPLYKVAKGKSEVYVKDEAALEDYLVNAGVNASVLEGQGGSRSGADLRSLVDHARRMRALMAYMPRRYDPAIIEGLALNGALEPGLGREARQAAAERAAAWLGRADLEARWAATLAEEGGYHLTRAWRGVTDHHIIDASLLVSQEALRLHALIAEQLETYTHTARLVPLGKVVAQVTDEADEFVGEDEDVAAPVAVKLSDKGAHISRPSDLLEAILAIGRKGLSIQRYKGLGEMNAEQLWETTLDPSNRSMLQVTIDDATDHDEIFTRLMGDVVEPRRAFIQDNALNVANLDI